MAFDTLIVFAGVYPDLASAETDYDLVKELHKKQLKADVEALERDAQDAVGQ